MGQVAYGSSKAAVEGLVLPMARDLARHGEPGFSPSCISSSGTELILSPRLTGIRVMCIAPSLFSTSMGKNTSDRCVSLRSLFCRCPSPQDLPTLAVQG